METKPAPPLTPETLRRAQALHEQIMKLQTRLYELLGSPSGPRAPRRRKGQKDYLTPPPLSPAARAKLYAAPDAEWDRVEAEAAARGRRALAGKRLEDL